MRERETKPANDTKSGENKRVISVPIARRNSSVLFVFIALSIFSRTVSSNQVLQSIQQGADNLMNGETFILPKSIAIDGTLLFKGKSNITIDGQGTRLTQLEPNSVTIKIIDCNSVTIKNLVLYGDPCSFNPAAQTLHGIGIFMQGGTGKHLLENVKFYDNGFTGFYAFSVSNITFNRCLFNANNVAVQENDNYNCGIYSYTQLNNNWEVKNCTFEKIGTGLILSPDLDHLSIHDNAFTDIRGQHGIYLNASSYVNIYNNTFTNVYGVSIKLQMNDGWNEIQTDINITNNTCNAESSHKRGQAGIGIGVDGNGPAEGVFWKNVCVENNRVNRSNYGVQVKYVKDANIFNNEFVDTIYGILTYVYEGGIVENTITTTEASAIQCSLSEGTSIAIVGNVITDAVHTSEGGSVVALGGYGTVVFENNHEYRGNGQSLYGLYQNPGITFTRYYNNILLSQVALYGEILSQGNNEIY